MSSRYQKLYETLLENDELQFFLPKFKGTWEEDSKAFIAMQREMEEIINFKDVTDAEDID